MHVIFLYTEVLYEFYGKSVNELNVFNVRFNALNSRYRLPNSLVPCWVAYHLFEIKKKCDTHLMANIYTSGTTLKEACTPLVHYVNGTSRL